MQRSVKVAIIGSGLAGLTTAHKLTQQNIDGQWDTKFEVHLFEKADTLGMDASSVSIPTNSGELRVDVPMRSFQGGYYPQLIKLYANLGVQLKTTNFSYSFSLLSPTSKPRTILIYNGSSALRGVSLPSLENSSQTTRLYALALFCLSTIHLLMCYIRLLILTYPVFRTTHLDETGVNTQSFASWEAQTMPKSIISRCIGLDTAWVRFTRLVLLPLFSGVCTASEEDILSHPVEEFLDYIYQTVFAHHYVAGNGVRDVVSRLTAGLDTSQIHLGAGVSFMQPAPNGKVHLHTENGQVYSDFDYVVFGTQANRAAPILETYLDALSTSSEGEQLHFAAISELIGCLRTFQYRRTIVVNHTDDRLMPENTSDWRDLNLFSPAPSVDGLGVALSAEKNIVESEQYVDQKMEQGCTVPATFTSATHLISVSSDLPPKRVYQTTNPTVAPLHSTVINIARLERAVLCAEAKRALGNLGRLQECGKTKFDRQLLGIFVCGSYASAGIPLLEGCVVSAMAVVDGIMKGEGL